MSELSKAVALLKSSGFSGEVSANDEITIFVRRHVSLKPSIFEDNGYVLIEKGVRPKSRETYLVFLPKSKM